MMFRLHPSAVWTFREELLRLELAAFTGPLLRLLLADEETMFSLELGLTAFFLRLVVDLRLAEALLAVDFLAVAFLAVDFLAVDFLAVAFLAVVLRLELARFAVERFFVVLAPAAFFVLLAFLRRVGMIASYLLF